MCLVDRVGPVGKSGPEKLIFRDHLLQAQEQSISTSRKSGKNARRFAWMNKELLTKLRHERG